MVFVEEVLGRLGTSVLWVRYVNLLRDLISRGCLERCVGRRVIRWIEAGAFENEYQQNLFDFLSRSKHFRRLENGVLVVPFSTEPQLVKMADELMDRLRLQDFPADIIIPDFQLPQ